MGSGPGEQRAVGLAIAALVTGILGLVGSVVPFLCFLAFVPATAAVVLGIVALVKRTTRRGAGLTGLILGGVAILLALVMTVVSIVLFVHLAEGTRDTSRGGFTFEESEADPVPAPSASAVVPDPGGPFVEGYTVSGKGGAVVEIAAVDGADSIGIATLNFDRPGYFKVLARDEAGEDVEWLASGYNTYTGTVMFNTYDGDRITALHIVAGGDWSIQLHSLGWLPPTTSQLSGSGDDVIAYTGSADSAVLECTSGNSFYVYSPDYGTEIEEWCPYAGEIDLPPSGLLQITTEGDWSFTPQQDIT